MLIPLITFPVVYVIKEFQFVAMLNGSRHNREASLGTILQFILYTGCELVSLQKNPKKNMDILKIINGWFLTLHYIQSQRDQLDNTLHL